MNRLLPRPLTWLGCGKGVVSAAPSPLTGSLCTRGRDRPGGALALKQAGGRVSACSLRAACSAPGDGASPETAAVAMAGERARSLGKGSTAPGPVPEGLIRVYSMRFCPFAERTLLVLKSKGIKHEIININLKNKPDWLFEKNPFGLVPILETSKGQLIYESPITCEYLDEAYPGKKLLPADPYERAYQKMLLERFSKLPPLAFKHLLAVKNGEDSSVLKAEFSEKLGEFEEILAGCKTVFYGGDSVSMIDYMIWPWFERLEFFQLPDCLQHTPKLRQWVEAMKKDPAVKATMTDTQMLKGFFELYAKNSPEACDYGL